MKRFVYVLFAFLLGWGASAQRYGVVDSDYILKQLPEYAQAQEQLNRFSEQWAGEVSALQSELQSLKDALAAERILLSPAKLEAREQSLATKNEELLALQQKYFGPSGELFTKRAQLIQPLQDKVFNAIREVAQRRKLDLVLDKSVQGNVLFVDREKDFSEEVLNTIKR